MSGQFNVESLESRTFLSAAQISYPNFLSSPDLVKNGLSSGSEGTPGSQLRLTDYEFYQARSVWYDTAVPIERFRTDFSFRTSQNTDGADGLTFAIINGPTTTLGAHGRGLGFGNINVPSEAVAFNQFNFNKFGTKFGFASNGERPPTSIKMPGIDLHSGHVFKVTVTYDGTQMKVAVTDATTRGKTFVATQNINLAGALETSDAIVGFTAGTGANRATHDVLSWSFAGEHAPVPASGPTVPIVQQAAAASPTTVSSKRTTLTALGSDFIDDENQLTYTWNATRLPSGAKAPAFSENRTNAAKSTDARFYKDGTYRFVATITNSAGLSSTSNVTVRVESTATYVGIDRHAARIRIGQTAQFNATMYDQFRRPMRTQPGFIWSMVSEPGTGTINSNSGFFMAGSTPGHITIAATASGLTGTVGAAITPKQERGVGAGS